ncbi:hypothetical protein OZX61_12790 (plasmid) [Acinetobacter sp. ESL0695]|uniref:hypothetical protein n=1 Tax=Acinetobacter sp. ESL0695 TaxID=2983215 RepID=UPI0023F305F2|nr:hypothetical protein [Acinetobacter sp. ESL0695]WEV50219.1 hypothetical protein OZX61_12790 [Acinetobacter sp. ESL0695]
MPYSYSKVSDKKLLIKARKLVDATNEFRYICGTKYIYVKDIKEQDKIFGSLFVKGNTSENSKLYDIILEEM